MILAHLRSAAPHSARDGQRRVPDSVHSQAITIASATAQPEQESCQSSRCIQVGYRRWGYRSLRQTPASVTFRRRGAKSNRDPESGIEMGNKGSVAYERVWHSGNFNRFAASLRADTPRGTPANEWLFQDAPGVSWTSKAENS